MSRVLLFLPTLSYRAPELLSAAQSLGVDVTIAAEKRNIMTDLRPSEYLEVDFDDFEKLLLSVKEFHAQYPIDAVLGIDDVTVAAASVVCQEFGWKTNSQKSVNAAQNKIESHQLFYENNVPCAQFQIFEAGLSAEVMSANLEYPCVIKPVDRSGSQGVMRVDDDGELKTALARIRKIQEKWSRDDRVIVERYFDGKEIAVEGILQEERLRVLTIFDKPVPLQGPFFEETIFVTPTQLGSDVTEKVARITQKGINALGLTTGPIHAEIRMNDEEMILLEIAPRPIGGKCSRSFRLQDGRSLEEVVLTQVLGRDLGTLVPDSSPSGVMMIPIPHQGIFDRIDGIETASELEGIVEILITAGPGENIEPLPEGSKYLGFIFARGSTRNQVVESLKNAHSELSVKLKSN
ncbi:MAG: ATP-grasp domain-containing protein [Candidatus Lindowbacteria bacterium]|nr:ATP-grasp domain-containing protein [Candidatus Lindowbacteria bacterium]